MNFELLNPIPPDDTLLTARVGELGSGWYVIACAWHDDPYRETTIAGPYLARSEAEDVQRQCQELRALTKRLTS